jgi:hypothetical protein
VLSPASIKLSANSKLDLLQRLDRSGCWHSIDDRRYCTICGHTITGRQIEVVGGTRGLGPLRLECPTEGCMSSPVDWMAVGQDGLPLLPGETHGHRAIDGQLLVSHHGRACTIRRNKALHPHVEPNDLPCRNSKQRTIGGEVAHVAHALSSYWRRLRAPAKAAGRIFYPIS